MGVLLAEQPVVQPAEQPANPHISYFARIALRTQSPPVTTHRRKVTNKSARYHITENKTTITATVPWGK